MRRVLLLLTAILLIVVIVFAVLIVKQGGITGITGIGGNTSTPAASSSSTSTTTHPATGILHVQGTRIVDATGQPVILRGGQIESPFNNIKGWGGSKQVSATLNSKTFQVMAQVWKMNVLRLPTSNWIYAKYTANYLSELDQVVQEANAAGLYVVLDLHDDAKSGSPYGSNANLPKTEDIAYWSAIAAHFKNNPMVMYDVYNEPQYTSWDTWTNGGTNVGGAQVVSMQALVNAIRSAGGQQIIVVEPGAAGHQAGTTAESGGWTNFPIADAIKDSNVIYSLHVYSNIAQSTQQQDAKWGPILNKYPLFYGEWAFLPNAPGGSGANKCSGVPHDQASQIVENFLNYMASRDAGWVAWSFLPHYLVQNFNTYTPTTLQTNWTCGDQNTTDVGMGEIVKQYLTTHGP